MAKKVTRVKNTALRKTILDMQATEDVTPETVQDEAVEIQEQPRGKSAKSKTRMIPAEPVTEVPADVEVPDVKPEKASEKRKRLAREKREKKARRRRQNFVDLLNGLFVMAFIACLLMLLAFRELQSIYSAAGPLPQDKIVVIPRDSGIEGIAGTLRKNGAIENTLLFQVAVYANQAATSLKAGEYQFKANASMKEIVAVLTEGKVIQHQLTLAEGLTSEQIVEKLKEAEILTGEVRSIPVEGSLLPNTYNVTRGTSRDVILERLMAAQKKAVEDVWAKRAADLPYKSPRELVIMASIIEKETGVGSERPMVASVFVNRLRKGMRLQSDPTIIYGLVGGKGKLDRPITRADIQLKTAYNTYTIDGLPPAPIANPGRAALEAAANPAQSNALYFVADGTGGHAFAESLEEHNRNVAKWREIERGRGATEIDTSE